MPNQQELTAMLQRLFPDSVQRGNVRGALASLPASQLDMLFGDADDEVVEQALLQWLASTAGAGDRPSQLPPEQKRVRIHVYSPYDDDYAYVAMNVNLTAADDLTEYLSSTQVLGLLEVTDATIPDLVRDFTELVDGGVYTQAPCSKEAFARMQEEAQHLQQARDKELGYAVQHHVQATEADQECAPRENPRSLPNCKHQTQEGDDVTVGKSAAWVGSHKTSVESVKPVKQIAGRAKELGKLPNQRPSCLDPAFTMQRADPTAEQKPGAVCQAPHVMCFNRPGRAIKAVNCMAAVGTQQLLRF